MRKIVYLAMATAVLSGCANNEQTGQLLGSLGGAGLGGVIGSHFGGQQGALIGAAVGGAGGFLVGGAIGRQLDQRDQQRVAMATQAVLAQPVTYQSGGSYQADPDMLPAPSSAQPAPRRNRQPGHSSVHTQEWTSDHSGAHGSSTVISATPATGGSGECKVVHNIAYIHGEEIEENDRYCVRPPNNDWQKAEVPLAPAQRVALVAAY